MKTFKGWKVPELKSTATQYYACEIRFRTGSCDEFLWCTNCLFAKTTPEKDFKEWKAQQ